ncbi:hypothetical protein CEXT_456871 [Caerostris extrusa]|uniref:Uncharacterized protein n=1 Tax=Caerostris extrusa TaxID=172846 RepID=A0AAV4RNS7_CAEEX|nr:hypothetical protein CEXT_456871 [Caerostris extrusa]
MIHKSTTIVFSHDNIKQDGNPRNSFLGSNIDVSIFQANVFFTFLSQTSFPHQKTGKRAEPVSTLNPLGRTLQRGSSISEAQKILFDFFITHCFRKENRSVPSIINLFFILFQSKKSSEELGAGLGVGEGLKTYLS